MGLDQYAFSKQTYTSEESATEIAYWRKHNRLQGWMENLWNEKRAAKTLGDRFIDALDEEEDTVFNCVNLYLTVEDLDRLEEDIMAANLPEKDGFFFGSDSYSDYDPTYDLEFIAKAREELAKGNEVYYTSWW